MGKIDVWLTFPDPPFVRGPLRFVAKFAHATPANLPGTIPVVLGLNFLADHLTETMFRCRPVPQAGSILFP